MSTDTREALAAPTDEQLEAMIAAWFETSGTFKQRMRAALATQPAQPSAQGEAVAKAIASLERATVSAYERDSLVLAALGALKQVASAPAAPSNCGLTECKNKLKCDRCKAWDSMGI